MNIYKSKLYLVFTFIAITLVLYSLFVIPHIKLGVEFKGGSLITVDTKTDVSVDALKTKLEQIGFEEVKITKFQTPFGYRLEIEVPNSDAIEKSEQFKSQFDELLKKWSDEIRNKEDTTETKKEIDHIMEQMAIMSHSSYVQGDNPNKYSAQFFEMYSKIRNDYQSSLEGIIRQYVDANSFKFQTISPSLSLSFIDKAKSVALISALLSIIIVFLIFRNIGPSIAVIIGAFSDIIVSMGGMYVFGIPLTLTSFSALLMLIGYSLDTDILLTTRVLKDKGDVRENAYKAMKTGLTMTSTGLLSFAVLFITSYILKISLYNQIASVALIGLVGDIFTTWGINAIILIHSKR